MKYRKASKNAKGVSLLKRHFSHHDMISTSRGIRPRLAMAIALVTAFTPPSLSYSSDILNTRIPEDYVGVPQYT